MRVSIDCTPLLIASAGIKTYLYHWTRALRAFAGEDSVRAFPFLNSLGVLDHEHTTLARHPTTARMLLLHFANIRGNPVLNWLTPGTDLFHASNQVRNPPRNKKLTATINDLTCWLVPETHQPKTVAGDKIFAERVLRRADGLIAISESSRNDAVRILGIPPERIEVIYPGVAEAYFAETPERIAAVKSAYGLEKPYVLFVGTIEPRKNVDAVLDAYSLLGRSLREQFDLVVSGLVGWAPRRTVERLSSPQSPARYLGYVPEQDLPGLIAGAAVFVYPSLYEGFGLPVAEAMAAGAPVVTSNVSSLPEVTGDAALLVDPRSVEEIRSALEKLLLSPPLRAQLSAAGRQRAQRFLWRDAAERSWKFFERVCGGSSAAFRRPGAEPEAAAAR